MGDDQNPKDTIMSPTPCTPISSTIYNMTKGQDRSYNKIILVIRMYITYKVRMKELTYVPWGRNRGQWFPIQATEKWNGVNP